MTAIADCTQSDNSDKTIEDALTYAEPMVLRGILHQLTGDPELAEMPVATIAVGHLYAQTLRDEADVATIQAKAATLLKSYRDSGITEPSIGPAERLHESLNLTAGVEIPDAEIEMWLEESAFDPWSRGLGWQRQPSQDQLTSFTVAVIGAGMGGLNAAAQLERAGVPYFVLEKNSGVGGTWFENRYPGARVDSPSRGYTHIFGVDFEFSNPFCEQRENERYFNWVADNFGVREHIEFETEVTSLVWNDEQAEWEIAATGTDGPRRFRANAVISAVGFLSRPRMPDIGGIDQFQGRAFHTARWPQDLSLEAKRVAIVGTGSTGYQLAPEVAKRAEHTYLFQRTPSWCFGIKGYLAPYPPQVLWLDRHLPSHRNFARFRSSHMFGPDTLKPLYKVDPDFHDPDAVSPINKRIRDERIAFMEQKFAGRPDLLEKMTPSSPVWSSRPVIVDPDASVYDALLQDDFTLVSEGVERLTSDGIVTTDGTEYKVDVVAFATGYKAADYLWPMKLRGRGGSRLEDLWATDGARAYLGSMLPGFPNFFMVYGPNTNPYGGLSVVDLEELVTRFALDCIAGLIEQELRSVDVTTDAYWSYNRELDAAEALTPYKDARVKTYYTNEFGRSPTQSPIDARRMWRWLRSPSRPHADIQMPSVNTPGAAELRPFFGEDLVVD